MCFVSQIPIVSLAHLGHSFLLLLCSDANNISTWFQSSFASSTIITANDQMTLKQRNIFSLSDTLVLLCMQIPHKLRLLFSFLISEICETVNGTMRRNRVQRIFQTYFCGTVHWWNSLVNNITFKRLQLFMNSLLEKFISTHTYTYHQEVFGKQFEIVRCLSGIN